MLIFHIEYGIILIKYAFYQHYLHDFCFVYVITAKTGRDFMNPRACAITGHRPTRFCFGYNENHPLCKELIPSAKKEWAQGRITVNRPVGIREPSVICQGVHGNITGMRADLIICDDVEVPNTCNTAQKRETLREKLRELDFILSPTGTMIYIGTPHTMDTIYRTKSES